MFALAGLAIQFSEGAIGDRVCVLVCLCVLVLAAKGAHLLVLGSIAAPCLSQLATTSMSEAGKKPEQARARKSRILEARRVVVVVK